MSGAGVECGRALVDGGAGFAEDDGFGGAGDAGVDGAADEGDDGAEEAGAVDDGLDFVDPPPVVAGTVAEPVGVDGVF